MTALFLLGVEEGGAGASPWLPAVLAVSAVIIIVAVVIVLVARSRRQRSAADVVDPKDGVAAETAPSDASSEVVGPELSATGQPPGGSTSPAEHERVGIFISYRRQDAPHVAGRLYDRLREHFGRERVFMDVDSIEPGLDFGAVIGQAIQQCTVMLVVIGQEWLSAADTSGARRLDNPDDYVRIEIEEALARDVRVIPVIVDGAVMPNSAQLPVEIRTLARRNGVEVTHRAFTSDADRLIQITERVLSNRATQR